MRLTRKAVLAGLASLAVAGAAVAAEKPAKPEPRAMEVALPDGGIVRISYGGDVAPQVSIGKGAADLRAAGFDPAPFAAMDRIMAGMDARAAQMMSRMRDMQVRLAAAARAAGSGDPGAMRWVSLPGFGPAVASLPPGAVSYSSVTTMSGGRSCTRTVQVTRTAADAAPQVVRRASGDCGSAADPAPAPPAPRTVAAPRTAKPVAPRPDRVI